MTIRLPSARYTIHTVTYIKQTVTTPCRPLLHRTGTTHTIQTVTTPYRLLLHRTDRYYTIQTVTTPYRPLLHRTVATLYRPLLHRTDHYYTIQTVTTARRPFCLKRRTPGLRYSPCTTTRKSLFEDEYTNPRANV